MIDIMLDLETWGTRAGYDIRSIGACVFDRETGEIGDTFYVAVENPRHRDRRTNQPKPYGIYPLKRDHETVKWWDDQSPEAQAAFTDPVDTQVGVDRFTAWLGRQTRHLRPDMVIDTDAQPVVSAPKPLNKCDVLRLWSHGPAFDVSILQAVYYAVDRKEPWHYRAPRDTRTIFDAAGLTDHSAFMSLFPVGTLHHALDDAISQAKAVSAAWRIMRTRGVTGS